MSRRYAQSARRSAHQGQFAMRHTSHQTLHKPTRSHPFTQFTAKRTGSPKPHLTGKVVHPAKVRTPKPPAPPVAYKTAKQAAAAAKRQARTRAFFASKKSLPKKPPKPRFTKQGQPIAPGYHRWRSTRQGHTRFVTTIGTSRFHMSHRRPVNVRRAGMKGKNAVHSPARAGSRTRVAGSRADMGGQL